MPEAPRQRPEPELLYRLMVWEYAIEDALGIGGLKDNLKLIPVASGMRVVDWGCGPGRYSLPLAKAVGPRGKVYALDVQPLAIRIVREKARKQGLGNVEAQVIDGYRAPVDSTSIDLVLVLHALHAIADRERLLREVHRILKSGGALLIDPGHLSAATAKETIERTGLYALRQSWGKIWLFGPVK